jgi:hypothetical protein
MAREAGEHFLAAVLSMESDAEAWAYAILMLAQADSAGPLLAATLAGAQLNSERIEFYISAKLALAGRSPEEARAILDSLRQLAQRAVWMFSYPPRSTIRLLTGVATGFEMRTGDAPPRFPSDKARY